MTNQHPRAEILRAVADCKAVQMRKIDDHWEEWWEPVSVLPYIDKNCYEFRIKPEIININGHEVPGPLRTVPPEGTCYYELEIGVSSTTWENWDADRVALKEGRAHLTGEAAEAHAKALLSFTEVKE